MAHRRNSGWLWLLIAAALFMRAMVPQGFMPERSESGTIALVVCGSGGVVHIPSDGKQPDKDPAPPHCAFAGLGTPADLPPPLALPTREWSGVQFAERREAAQRAAALYPRPPSRGPPILA